MTGQSQIISISIDADILSRFDGWVAAKGFASRSSGFQHLVREKLDSLALLDERGPAVATVTFVYDHHRRDLMERLAHLQHEHLEEVVASTHVHLDHLRCLEVLILRGPAKRIRALGEQIVATKGVERGEVIVTSAVTGAAGHDHEHEGPAWHAQAHQHGEHEHEIFLPRLERKLGPRRKAGAKAKRRGK